MDLNNFFQFGPLPADTMHGTYTWYLVVLSYVIAFLASFVALDIAERIRTSGESLGSKIGWLIGGSIAMGMGVWSMHFIGMLAFVMPMPMHYDLSLTILSLFFAVFASGFAFYLIKNDVVNIPSLMFGGIFMGMGIVGMHYTGMVAMDNVQITYIPSLFILSVAIAVVASEAALWLMIKSSKRGKRHLLLKTGSALIMALAICGMHYTGMAAAVFESSSKNSNVPHTLLDPNALSLLLAGSTTFIISIALAASRFWMYALQSRNEKLVAAERSLEQKTQELQKVNINLSNLAEQSIAREEEIRNILAAAGDGILVMDKNGKIEICNHAATEMLQYSEDNILKMKVTQFIGKIENKEFKPVSIEELLNQPTITQEYFGLCKDNNIIPIELHITTSKVEDKTRYIMVFRDITERKKAQENLSVLNHNLVVAARQAGMAEVATSVLHNIGNVLNSVNISAQLLLNTTKKYSLEGLEKASDLLEENKNQLADFFTTDSFGKMLPEYFKQTVEYLNNERKFLHKELESLNTKIQHIRNIVVMQQSLSKSTQMTEETNLNEIIDEALSINEAEKKGVIIKRDFEQKYAYFKIDKVRVIQILVNLIKNALESLTESGKNEKILTLRTKILESEKVQIEVTDNGKGISAHDMEKIFTYGYTTKEWGHGFGLHPSALSAQELGGSLKAYSDGIGKGATFVLTISVKSPKETILTG